MVRFGLIGCGRISQGAHVPAFKQLSRIARVSAISDLSEECLETVGDLLGVDPARRYRDYGELLRAEKGRIDVVDLALPHAVHRPVLIDSAKAGYAVLTEKPLVVDLKEARQVARALEKYATHFGIIHNYLWHPTSQAAIKLCREGKLGRVFLHRTEGLGGSFYHSTPSFNYAWRSQGELGGHGCLLDNGYHNIYTAEHLVGSPIVGAYAVAETYNRDYTVEDTAVATFTHENGATTLVMVSWGVNAGGARVMEVHGTKGSLSQNHPDIRPMAYFNNATGRWRSVNLPKRNINGFVEIIKAYCGSLQAGKPYQHGIEAAWNQMAILDAAYCSAKTGRREKVQRYGG